MNPTRKKIIELIEPYMEKTLSRGHYDISSVILLFEQMSNVSDSNITSKEISFYCNI